MYTNVQPPVSDFEREAHIRNVLLSLNARKGAFAKMTWREISADMPLFNLANHATLRRIAHGAPITDNNLRRAWGLSYTIAVSPCPTCGEACTYDCGTHKPIAKDAATYDPKTHRTTRKPGTGKRPRGKRTEICEGTELSAIIERVERVTGYKLALAEGEIEY